MAFDPRSIDESPLFKLLTDVVVNGPASLAKGIARLGEGLGGLLGGESEGRDASGSLLASLKSSIFGIGGDGSAREQGQERTPAAEIATPAPSLGKYEVSVTELGSFSAPTFGSMPAQGTGISRIG